MAEQEITELSGFDLGLIAVFFISWSALAVTQLAMLFGERYVAFGVIIAAALTLAFTLPHAAAGTICGDTNSILACSNEGRGLTLLSLIWVAISVAMLAMYGFVLLVRRWKAARQARIGVTDG